MAYQINKTNGSVLLNLQDGTKNTTASSLTLVGKNYPGYGELFNENFVHLLENFANNTEPTTKLVGQCWYDTSTGQLKFYNGSTFKATGAVTVSSTAPVSNARGDLWFRETTDQLYVYSGTSFKLIGPLVSSNSGFSGLEPTTLIDDVGTNRSITLIKNSGVEVGLISDFEFSLPTIRTGYSGAKIRKGITMVDSIAQQGQGELRAHKISASNLSSSRIVVAGQSGELSGFSNFTYDGNKLTVPTLEVTSEIVGTAISAGTIAVTSTGSTQAHNVTFTLASSGTAVIAVNSGFTYRPSTGTLTANIFSGTATNAVYADLAENYLTDAIYEPGTVVVIGGEVEATMSTIAYDKKVLGVISSNPAYLMNSESPGQPIALRGRVPCKVTGTIQKGDLLVTSGLPGYAQTSSVEFENSRAVFAKALENKTDSGEGVVEVLIL
jgi:hypothetical protein